jgi:hypothetical protein
MKIQKIEVHNFKAIKDQSINLNGCSAIITAGNNKGKTSMLSGLINRFRSEIPDVIVKDGEEKGFNILHLDDGSQIKWNFTQKGESFHFITKEGIKVTSGVIGQISEKYFGQKFDVDKFIQSGAKEQSKVLQKIVGIDLTEIDCSIAEQMELRKEAKKELDRIISNKKEAPELVEEVNIFEISVEIKKAKDANNETTARYTDDCILLRDQIDAFNQEQDVIEESKSSLVCELSEAKARISNIQLLAMVDFSKAESFIDSMKTPEADKVYTQPPAPELIDVSKLEAELQEANEHNIKFALYESKLTEYNDWVESGKSQRVIYDNLDIKVKDLQKEKVKKISDASIPADFEIVDGEVKYKGFALSNEQMSSSSKYIAALKLGAMVTGELKTMHFDASFLDNNSLKEVQDWAVTEGLQLLIERPDFDGGEIQYEIIQEIEAEEAH